MDQEAGTSIFVVGWFLIAKVLREQTQMCSHRKKEITFNTVTKGMLLSSEKEMDHSYVQQCGLDLETEYREKKANCMMLHFLMPFL